MIIRFTLSRIDQILEEYECLFAQAEPLLIEKQHDEALVVSAYRIVVPEIHASFRSGDWYSKNTELNEPVSDDDREPQCSVYVLYDENEVDVKKYLSFASCSPEQFIFEASHARFPSSKDIGDVP